MNTPMPPAAGAAAQPAGQGAGPADALPGLALRADGLRLRRWTQAWRQPPVALEQPGRPAEHAAACQPLQRSMLAQRAAASTSAAGNAPHGGPADTGLPARPALPAPEAPAEAHTLAQLRGLHASRRAAMAPDTLSQGEPDATQRPSIAAEQPGQALAAGAMPAMVPAPLPAGTRPASGEADGRPVPADAQTLQALVEACGARVLVQAPARGAAAGVLLQLHGSLAGCALQMQQLPGGLRLTLRVAAGERRDRLAAGLASLGDELARTLGCPVMLAVDDALDGLPR